MLSALDQPIMVGREQKPDVPQNESESAQRTNAMTTAEVTRRAIEQGLMQELSSSSLTTGDGERVEHEEKDR